ncbi:hypothetical protein VIBNISOn1_1390010 [Vibrio nigripulchritudo SOn1]|uniref:Uncharacterized protein n=1 Tax=Vibrio nigripulchritudo SOn1 TaxID=1238450 RepID=A0AAV2VKB8_9VIBR|nr:hypothetical protein VIBNISOn1_1390010 [Vibrio nigripulchritudo SOn1]
MSTQKLTQIHLPYGSVIVDKGQRLGNVSSLERARASSTVQQLSW